MNNSFYLYQQILKTYLQRPLILLLTAGFLLVFLFFIFGPTSGNMMQVGARPQAVGRVETIYTTLVPSHSEEARNLQTLSDLLEQHDPEEIRSLRLMKGTPDGSFPDLSLFQNLAYLNLSNWKLTQEDIEQICQLPKLDALVLSQTELPEGALQSVGQKVSQLEIDAVVVEAHADEISEMSKVKLLALHYMDVSTELLELVTQIPQLQQLSLIRAQNYDPNHKSSNQRQVGESIDLSEEQIALMKNCPPLKEVYANWFFMKHFRKFDESAFLPVRALPDRYSKSKLNAMRVVFLATSLLFAILALQLWVHFISPAAALVPNYLVPHRQMAVWIFCIGSLFPWLSLLRYDVGVLPALSLTLFLPAMYCLCAVTLLSTKRGRQWMLPMLPIVCWFLALLTDMWFKASASDAIWFLYGQMPTLALTIILIEVLCVVWSLTKLPAITEKVNETFLSTPAFSAWDCERAQQRKLQKSNRSTLWLLDRDTSKLRYFERSTWQMVSLWQKGNTIRPMILILFLVTYLLIFLLFRGGGNVMRGVEFFSQNIHLIGLSFATPFFVGVVLPAIGWWQRCKTMELETLRPINRKALVKQLYLSMALDHVVVAIGSLGLFVLLVKDVPGTKVELVCLLLLFSVSATLWVLGINATIFVFKRAWVIIASMFAGYALAVTLLVVCVIWVVNLQSSSTHGMPFLFNSILATIVAALGLNILMYRLALNREWG